MVNNFIVFVKIYDWENKDIKTALIFLLYIIYMHMVLLNNANTKHFSL